MKCNRSSKSLSKGEGFRVRPNHQPMKIKAASADTLWEQIRLESIYGPIPHYANMKSQLEITEPNPMEKHKDRFKNHVLTEVLNTENLKVFDFRNANGDINMYQRWIIDRGTLIVTGDCYAAVYYWNSTKITLQFLAKCNLGYFNEKCVADKDGSGQKVFDSSDAHEYLKSVAANHILENNPDFENINIKDLDDEQKFDLVKPIISNTLELEGDQIDGYFYAENAFESYAILADERNAFMFGANGWEYAQNIETLTDVPKWHLAALRVAHEKYGDIF